MVEKTCKKHGPTPHAVPKNPKQGGPTCRKCRVEHVTKRRHKVKQILVAEAGGKCRLCGYSKCIRALEFHHLDPLTKEFEITGSNHMRAIAKLRVEAAKCVLLCANCHREVEAGIVVLP